MLTNSSEDQAVLREITNWNLPAVRACLTVLGQNQSVEAVAKTAIAAAERYGAGAKRDQVLRRVSMAAFKLGKDLPESEKYVTRAASAVSAIAYTHTDLRTGDQGWRQARHILGPVVYAIYALELAGELEIATALLADIAKTPQSIRLAVQAFPEQPETKKRLDQLFKQVDEQLR